MHNLEDSSDPTTVMNKALALLAKTFKINTIPTNNNQRSSLIPRNSQISQSGMNTSQDIKMQMVDDNVGNQYGNGDVFIAPAEGNGNGINDAYEETERVKVNCTSDDTLQQAYTSGTQSDNAPVYDSDGLTEVPKDENYYDHDIFNMLTHEVQYTDLQTELDRTKKKLENCIIKKEKEYVILWNNWYTKCEECKYDKVSYDKAYNDIQQKIEWLQAQLGDLKGKSSDTQCALNTLDLVSRKLKDKNVPLEFQSNQSWGNHLLLLLLDQNFIMSLPFQNPQFSPKLIRRMPNPSKTSRVDNVVPNKLVKTSVRIKPITVSQPNVIHKQQANSNSNGFSSTRVNNTAKTRRPHPRSNSNTDRVKSKSKSSCLSNNIEKIEEMLNPKHMSSECNNITLAIRNAKFEIVCVMCKQCLVTANHEVCVLNYVNGMNSRADNQSDNVSKRENKKKHKANAKKLKELGSKGSLASSRPSKPRTCLSASTSNPSEPSSKGFPISTSLIGRLSRLRK
ncbi:hypothetical protein Tco_1546840 [Tanacetum coccineum]